MIGHRPEGGTDVYTHSRPLTARYGQDGLHATTCNWRCVVPAIPQHYTLVPRRQLSSEKLPRSSRSGAEAPHTLSGEW